MDKDALKSKIEVVASDLKKLESEGGNIRKIEALTEYKKYLEDELAQLENDDRSRTCSK